MRRTLLVTLSLAITAAVYGCGGQVATLAPFTGSGITVKAEKVQFSSREIQLPAGQPLRIVLDNRDAGVPHDISVRQGSQVLATSAIVSGPATTEVRFGPLEPGTYQFICTVHPAMTGTLTIVSAP